MARAPGRLDVMGGIADYSGSLVLQMPLAEACHVAVQRHAPAAAGSGSGLAAALPLLRVVSFDTAGSHRSPAFEIELAELVRASSVLQNNSRCLPACLPPEHAPPRPRRPLAASP